MDLLASYLIFCIIASGLGIGYGQNILNVIDFGATGDGCNDDSQGFLDAWKRLCAATNPPILQITVNQTLLLQSMKLEGPCKSKTVHIQVLGKLVAQTNEQWTDCGAPCWLCFYNVNGLIIDGTGTIDGQGSTWWKKGIQSDDLYVDNKKFNRPRALYFQRCNNLQLHGLNHLNSQRNHITVHQSNSVSISNLHITAPEDSPNTDGIVVSSSSHVDIFDSFIGTGDDCIAIKGGSSYINITHITCGPGHGISVGSLGDKKEDDKVEEVLVQHCSFDSTQNGVRIKTTPGGSGSARAISFQHITLTASKKPIIIDQYYCNGRHCREQGSAVKVSDITYSYIEGTSKDEQAITLDCSKIGCNNIVMDHINITSSAPGKKTYGYCKNSYGRSTSTMPTVPCL